MRIKLCLIAAIVMTLGSCHIHRETSAQYERLPIKVSKKPEKEGRSCGSYPLFFSIIYTNNDFTIESARKNGEISEIISIEKEVTSSLLNTQICTVVRGN